MAEPSLFGLSKTTWDFINGFANWFAAGGSLAAAGVALCIANRAGRPSAHLSVGHRITIGPGSTKPYPEFVVFRIVNTGDRPLRVNQLGWKVGLLRKRFAVQMYDERQSSRLPIELSHGQEATWFVPLNTRDETWLEYFAKGMLLPSWRTALWTLRGQVFTSVGYIFECRPEESLLKKLRDACAKIHASEN